MLKQDLSQKQKLKISQQNIQLFRMMELNSIQFDEKIREELELNPALEDEEDDSNYQENLSPSKEDNDFTSDSLDYEVDDFGNEIDFNEDSESFIEKDNENEDYDAFYQKDHQYNEYDHNVDDDERDLFIPIVDHSSIISNLINQFKYNDLTTEEFKIGEYIIGNIDHDGYLRREIQSIVDDLAFRYNIDTSEEKVEQILELIQNLDPPGIGARNIQENILIQLYRKPYNTITNYAIQIVDRYFEQFVKKNYSWIIKKLKITQITFDQIVKLITSLNPKPIVEDEESKIGKFIVPDFFIYKEVNSLKLELHSYNMPNLFISQDFIDMIKKISDNRKKSKAEKDAITYMNEKIQSAQNLITTIKQRQETMILIMQSIVNIQKKYFLSGDESTLLPMALKDISEQTGFDVSTVSRVTNSKYIQTEFGILSMKYFFSDKITNDEGEEISTRKIKQALKELVDVEDKNNPYTDEEITNKLLEKGFKIARRTASKYREQLGIAPRHVRKNSQ
jgi:RNA polymerase sigma-54 factor